MSKLLLIGIGPYPTEPGAVASGPTIRVRFFAEPLIKAGHEVTAVFLESRVRKQVAIDGFEGAIALTPKEILEPWKVLKALNSPPVDAVMGIGSLMPLAAASRLGKQLDKPVWIDFNGDPLAEYHAGISRKGVKADMVLRDHLWKFVRESLLAGDAFSTCSERQRHAIMGQMLLLGRLTEGITPHQFIHSIPNGVPRSWCDEELFDPEFPAQLEELGIEPDNRIIYIGGSWTPWMEEHLMGKAVGQVLSTTPNAVCVVRGNRAESGLPGRVRRNFFEALGQEAPAGSVHEISPETIREESILPFASTTILLDRDIPESELGARNRLLPFVRFGLMPVVFTRSEIAVTLVNSHLAVEPAEAVGSEVFSALRRSLMRTRDEITDARRRGQMFLRDYTFEKVTAPVLDWAVKPEKWPPLQGDGLLPRWAKMPT